MKRYEVTVNGEVYEVTLRELKEGETVAVTSQVAPPSQPTVPSPTTSEGTEIKAPMSGVIMAIKVSENQAVKAGEVLFILEAMKMENEIKAPKDGFVKQILVKESQQVETSHVLAII